MRTAEIQPLSMKQDIQSAFDGRTLVLGLGATGYSVVRFLRRHGLDVLVQDTRAHPPLRDRLAREYPDVQFFSGVRPLHRLPAFERIVISPGIPPQSEILREAVESGTPVIGDIEIFSSFARRPILAVTGSNGKSTVATLCARLCRQAGLQALLGGNIGIPALDLLMESNVDIYVLELSSFQLDTTFSLLAKGGVILNITPDHLDRYGDLSNYVASKCRLAEMSETLVLNRDDSQLANVVPLHRRQLSIGLGAPPGPDDWGLVEFERRLHIMHGEQPMLPVGELTMVGRHNVLNSMAAAALADIAGARCRDYRPALESFAGLPHRCEVVSTGDQRTWINDSKGTNPGATLAALEGFDSPVILIAGGQAKGADFKPLAGLAGRRYRHLVLIGEDADRIAAAMPAGFPVDHVSSLSDAIQRARALSLPGETILFSPACASFDMFRNFEHRGDSFRQLLQEAGDEQ